MKKLLFSSIVAISLLGTQAIALDANASTKTVTKSAITKGKKIANAKKGNLKISKEAVESVKLVADTIVALDKKNKDEAIKTLEKAIGKIEVVLSSKNAPALLPLDGRVVVQEFAGSAYDADEIDFTTVNLPLASYPVALKEAAKYLQDNKVDEAKALLAQTLNTFVNVTTVTPIGILEAQTLVDAASKIAKKDKKLALSHLEQAKEALKKSQALGYVSRSDTTYKMLNDAISNIQKEIKGKNEAEKLFEDLIEKLKEFKEKALKTVKK